MSNFGNLLLAGITSGAIYAVFAACLSIWFRVANVLNLAIGDFAMIGAIGTAELAQDAHMPLWLAILIPLVASGLIAWAFDWVVLHPALDGGRGHSGIVSVFFYTFALSFILEGAARIVFGTDVHAAPALWSGNALSFGSLHIERAGILVLGLAIVIGGLAAGYLYYTMSGKAATASGESVIGSRVVGINTHKLRRQIFVTTAVIAALFGVVESPLTGFTFSSGPTISLIGVVAAGFAGFRRPGRAVVAGLLIGLAESFLGGYLSTSYNEILLYALLAVVIMIRPGVLGIATAH
ncbi:MAG TPA: branched-chain amino acid ABC transporter permease [Pseudonocardiaceae bacterium]|nr:branched-chain amino acid ABC transporter permease [Pseudonocardiaceae bacterium]